MNNAFFYDPALQKQFDKKGYCIVNALSESECDEIIAFHNSQQPVINSGFFASHHSPNYEYRKNVEEFLRPLYLRLISQFLIDYDVVHPQFMVKYPSKDNECNVHQDWTYADEPKYTSVNFWCALHDVNEKNGCLWIMPGSHNMKNYLRGRNIIQPWTPQVPFIQKFLMVPIPLKKGQAVLFNARTLHGSLHSLMQEQRIALAAIAVPREAQPIHYLKLSQDDTRVLKLNVSNDFFFELSLFEMPAEKTFENEIPYKSKKVSKLDLLMLRYSASVIL